MYTRDQIIQQYRDRYGSKASDDTLYYHIMKANPNLSKVVSDHETAAGKSILDHLPNFVKEGYNRSITGHVDELLSGGKRFDMSNYSPGALEDIAAGAISLMMPTEGFGLSIPAKIFGTAGKILFKSFAGLGVPKKVANDAVKKAIAYRTGASAGIFGTYSGMINGLRQQIDTGEIKLDSVGEDVLKGSLSGFFAGFGGGTLSARGASSLTKVATEAGILGTTSPLLEGRAPTPDDYLHTAGIILGVKGGQKLFSSPSNFRKLFEKTPTEETFKPTKDVADKLAQSKVENDMNVAMTSMEWRSGELAKNNKPFSRVRITGEQGNRYKLEDLNTRKYRSLDKNTFHGLYKRGQADYSKGEIRSINSKEIQSLEKELGYTPQQAQGIRSKYWTNPDNKNFSTLKRATDEGLFTYKERLKSEKFIMDESARLQSEGIKISVMPRKNMIDNYLPKRLADFMEGLKSPESRFTDPNARIYLKEVNNYMNENVQLATTFFNQALKAGMGDKISRKKLKQLGFKNENEYWENFSDRKERGELPVWDSISNMQFLAAKEAGVIVPGYVRHHVPKMMKPEIAEIVFNDVQNVATKMNAMTKVLDAMSGGKDWLKNNPEQAAKMEAFLRKSNLSPETRKIIEMNRVDGSNPLLRSFLQVGRFAYNDLYSVMGNLEKSRSQLSLPKEMLERNYKKLFYRYSYGVAKRIAEAKTFGVKGEKYKALRELVEANDALNQANIMREVHAHVTGSINKDPAYNLSPTSRKLAEQVMAFETSTKIALGTATIPNMSQFMISSALDAGYYRFFRGIMSLANPKTRDFIKRSGATEWDILTDLLGTDVASSRSQKIADGLSRWSGFKGVNKINQIVSAATGQIYIKDLMKIANKGSFKTRREWAQGKLSSMGIDYTKPLTEKVMLNGINKFARNQNLQKDILKDPLIMNNPKLRWAFQFKRFGYRQFKLIDQILREDLKRGNVASLVRLGLAGYAGGAFVSWAKDIYKRLLGGEKVVDPNAGELPKDWEDFMQSLASVGAIGMMGDFLSAVSETGGDPTDSVKFMVTPPVISSVDKIFDFFQKMQADVSKYGADAVTRLPSRLSTLAGTAPQAFIQRIEPEGLAEERLQGIKSRRVKIINKLLDKGEYEKAFREVRNWNKSNPRNPISGRSISMKNVIRRKVEKLKKLKQDGKLSLDLSFPGLDDIF